MSQFYDNVCTFKRLLNASKKSDVARKYLQDALMYRKINYVGKDYFTGNYSLPYIVGDLKFGECPSWSSFAIESYDLIYSDKFYSYTNGGLLNDDRFLYYSIGWREGPYQIDKVRVEKNDVVVDCGANLGMFSMMSVKMGASKVHAFEPITLKQLNENIKLNNMEDSIVVHPNAVFSENKSLSFDITEDFGSHHISSTGNTIIECVPLNSLETKVDFIKADIEGAERDMLIGASKTLKEYAPKLSLCTYHRPDDKKVMTKLIKKANPDYKFYYTHWKLYAWTE